MFADGFWKQPPAQDYLDVLGATADEMVSHAGNAAPARDAGFRVADAMARRIRPWHDAYLRWG